MSNDYDIELTLSGQQVLDSFATWRLAEALHNRLVCQRLFTRRTDPLEEPLALYLEAHADLATTGDNDD